MWERVEWIKGRIEEAGPKGIEEDQLYTIVFNNLHCQARTARQYVDNLISIGKVRRSDGSLVSANYDGDPGAQTSLSIHIQRTEGETS